MMRALADSEFKMAMVSNKFLGALAVKLGLHTHLQHFSAPLQSSITHYAEEMQTAETESDGAMDYWLSTKDSPKVPVAKSKTQLGRVNANIWKLVPAGYA